MICHWILLRMRNVSDKIFRENQNTHFMLSNFFRKPSRLWGNVETFCGVRGHKWQYNISHASCVLDKQRYTRTHARTHPRALAPIHTCARAHTHTGARIHTEKYVIFNCSSTATVVSRTRFNITLHVHFLSFFFYFFQHSKQSKNKSNMKIYLSLGCRIC